MRKDSYSQTSSICDIKNTGWKFHICIDDSDIDNLERSWDIIKE